MANYTSHMIMSELLYDKLKRKISINIDKDLMKIFSLGQDLTYLNSACFKATHMINSKKFFKETINYIYKNKLQYDEKVMSYLYGHIAHYSLDIAVHKFIKKLINDVDSKSIITPHNIVECDIDIYLINKYYKNKKYDFSFLNTKIISDRNISSIINNTYKSTYGYTNISDVYKKTIMFIKPFSKVLQYLYFNNIQLFNMIVRKSKYEYGSNFYNYIHNEDKNIYTNILDNSIKNSERIIRYVNNYLYYKNKEKYLDLVFDDTPYDIGLVNEVKYGVTSIPIYSRIQVK